MRRRPLRAAPVSARAPVGCPTEAQEQRALGEWLTLRGILWCHVPNGGERSLLEAVQLKRMGVMPGVPDILIFDPPPFCSLACKCIGGCTDCKAGKRKVGVAIEMKRQKRGRTAPGQQRWLECLNKRGWLGEVCCGAAKAVTFLRSVGY